MIDNEPDPRPAGECGSGREAAQGDDEYFRPLYRDAPYYSTGRAWKDYKPAYRYGREAFARHAGSSFEAVEAELARRWVLLRGDSRLAWVEARGAVRAAWQRTAEMARMAANRRR